MRPTEPGAAENSSTDPPRSAESLDPAAPLVASPQPAPVSQATSLSPPALSASSPTLHQEPPQLAYLPLARSDEPVMATILPDRAWEVTRPSMTPVAIPGASGSRPYFFAEFAADPLWTTAKCGQALFSQEAQEALFGGRSLDKIYSVPRRFDLSTLFVVSTAFAILFTVLGYLGFSDWAKLAWCFFFSGVGFAQAALYHGRAPRLASVVAGGLLLPLLTVPRTSTVSDVQGAICMSLGMLIGGLPAGYISGTLIGGVFLVADKLRNWIARRRAG